MNDLSPARLASLCDRAGMTPDEPLRELVMALAEDQRGIRQLLQSLQAKPPPRVLTPNAERELTERLADDANRAVYEATWRAQADVRKTMTRWTAAGIAGVTILASLATGFGVHMVDTRVADARMQAARIDVPAVFGALPAGDAAGWAKLMRDNPPFRDLLETARPFPTTGGKAVSMAVWINPPKPAAPASH